MARGSLLWTAVLATVVVAGACSSGREGSGGREGNDVEDEGVSGPTAAVPAPTPAPATTPQPGASPTPAPTALAFDQDIAPILRTDCAGCHAGFVTYGGVMPYVQPGNVNSMLVAVTQPGGIMYPHLSGDRAAKADLIRRWVVDYAAQQTR